MFQNVVVEFLDTTFHLILFASIYKKMLLLTSLNNLYWIQPEEECWPPDSQSTSRLNK
jgi:hypothetical protein